MGERLTKMIFLSAGKKIVTVWNHNGDFAIILGRPKVLFDPVNKAFLTQT